MRFAHKYGAANLRRVRRTVAAPSGPAAGTCAYERALTWAMEATELDLPRLSAQCKRFLAISWVMWEDVCN